MAADWPRRRIGDLGRVVTGKTPTTSDPGNFGGPYPFITIPDLDGRVFIGETERSLSKQGSEAVRTSQLPPGAVMMSCIATVGKSGITTKPSYTNQQINSVIPREGTDARFLYYVFTQLGRELESHGGGGSVYTNVSKSRFSDVEVYLPPLPEQRAIARILGALDDKIELNRRMNETLEAIARAIFKSWFVDFDPVRAKAEGRDPGLPPDLAALFPDSFEDSELGEVPKGWRIGRLGDLLKELVSGARPKGGALPAGVPSIGAENVLGLGQYDFSKDKFVPEDFFAELSKKGAAVQPGDVLLYKDGANIGRKTYFDCGFPHDLCAVNEHVFILRAKLPQCQRFLFFWLDQETITQDLISLNSNSAQPGINQTGVRTLPVLIPDHAVLAAFDALVAPPMTRIFHGCHESRSLATIRDALLPKLLSGEIRVPIPASEAESPRS